MKNSFVTSHVASICFLLGACLPSIATSSTPADDVPPTTWMNLADIKEEPAHKMYLGGSRVLSYNSSSHKADKAHWVVWGKFVYKEPQKFKDKLVVTELFAVHIDCAEGTYSSFRDIKLDDKDQVIDDSRAISKFQSVPKEFDGLGFLPPAESVAEGAQSFTCGADAE